MAEAPEIIGHTIYDLKKKTVKFKRATDTPTSERTELLLEDEREWKLDCEVAPGKRLLNFQIILKLLSRLSECRAQLQVEQDNCGRLEAKLAAAESREAKLREAFKVLRDSVYQADVIANGKWSEWGERACLVADHLEDARNAADAALAPG